MTSIPQHLLDLATEAVYAQGAEPRSRIDFSDAASDHAPLIAAAVLRPVLAELRRKVAVRREEAAIERDREAAASEDPLSWHYESETVAALDWVLALLITGGSDE